MSRSGFKQSDIFNEGEDSLARVREDNDSTERLIAGIDLEEKITDNVKVRRSKGKNRRLNLLFSKPCKKHIAPYQSVVCKIKSLSYKARERTAFLGRKQRDQGPAEGGPDTGLPQGPTTKAQVARKGFDPRRSLADQTINPDIVERVATMMSVVDEAYSGVGKKGCVVLPILAVSTKRPWQLDAPQSI
jgi:hypothetical protein